MERYQQIIDNARQKAQEQHTPKELMQPTMVGILANECLHLEKEIAFLRAKLHDRDVHIENLLAEIRGTGELAL